MKCERHTFGLINVDKWLRMIIVYNLRKKANKNDLVIVSWFECIKNWFSYFFLFWILFHFGRGLMADIVASRIHYDRCLVDVVWVSLSLGGHHVVRSHPELSSQHVSVFLFALQSIWSHLFVYNIFNKLKL